MNGRNSEHKRRTSKEPQQIHNLIEELCHRFGIHKKIMEHTAISKWSQIVGERISKETQPLGVRGGKLFLWVENSSWRNELTFMKKEIINRLNRSLGEKVIRDIIFSNKKGDKGKR